MASLTHPSGGGRRSGVKQTGRRLCGEPRPAQHGACVFTLHRDCKGLEEALALNSSAIPAFGPQGPARVRPKLSWLRGPNPRQCPQRPGARTAGQQPGTAGCVLMSPLLCLIVSSGLLPPAARRWSQPDQRPGPWRPQFPTQTSAGRRRPALT